MKTQMMNSFGHHMDLHLSQKENGFLKIFLKTLGTQSFTSLMADLCHNINSVSSFSRCLNETFRSIKVLVNYLRREDLYLLLFSFGLIYQCFNGAIRKCSIKAPVIWRNSVYVLMEICHQRSKWLCPKCRQTNVNSYLGFEFKAHFYLPTDKIDRFIYL